MADLAWGAKVSSEFRRKNALIAGAIGVEPSDTMACMAFESGETFSPSVKNGAGSGAVGLIQFMPSTAAALGTTTQALAAMTAEQQLDTVKAYFWPWRNKLHNLGDLYMAILWPAGIGQPDSYVLFDRADHDHPARYVQNRGLDFNADGKITRGEACRAVVAKMTRGLQPPFVWRDAA